MKRIAILLIVAAAALLLPGCGTFGHDDYTVTSKTDATGKTTYDLTVKSSKEYSGRSIQFKSEGGAVGFVLEESASKAFAGQAIGAKVLTIMPVSGLDDLVPKNEQTIRVLPIQMAPPGVPK